jgi:hypothetical protein
MERHRIDAPAPAPVEHTSYTSSETGAEETKPIALEEPSHLPATAEAATIAHHEETVAKETKRDWM